MPSKQQSILLGGLVAGLLSTSYLSFINFLCCAGILAGAIVAVWHYTDSNELTIKPGEGAVLGVLAALVGWGLSFVLNYALMAAGIRADLAVSQFMLDRFGASMPPEQYDTIVAQMEEELTFGKYFVSALPGLALSALFGAIGGAIGSVLFKKGGDLEAA